MENPVPKYKTWFYVACIFNGITLLVLLGQYQLNQEFLSSVSYTMDLKESVSKIKLGMSRGEVVSVVGHQPDQIEDDDEKVIFRWSPAFHQGRMNGSLNVVRGNPYDGPGTYFLIVAFNKEGRVVRILE